MLREPRLCAHIFERRGKGQKSPSLCLEPPRKSTEWRADGELWLESTVLAQVCRDSGSRDKTLEAPAACPPTTNRSFCFHWNMFTREGITSPGSAPLLLTWRIYVLPCNVYPPALLLHKPRQFFHGMPLSIFKGNRHSPQLSHHLGPPRMWLLVVSSFRLTSLSMALITQSQRDP